MPNLSRLPNHSNNTSLTTNTVEIISREILDMVSPVHSFSRIRLNFVLRKYVMKITWKRLILIWDNASFHLSMTVRKYINTQKDWLTIIHLPKKAPYLNPNERKVNERIKSDVCTNRFYEHIEDQKAAISEYLDKRFGRWE